MVVTVVVAPLLAAEVTVVVVVCGRPRCESEAGISVSANQRAAGNTMVAAKPRAIA